VGAVPLQAKAQVIHRGLGQPQPRWSAASNGEKASPRDLSLNARDVNNARIVQQKTTLH
jgi:hypothetical protein